MPQTDDRAFSRIAADPPPDLDAVRRDLFAELDRGAASSSRGFHLPVISTVDAARSQAAARTVVLRGFDAEAGTLRCHTDLRSPKVDELRGTPHACWVFYDRGSRTQVVAEGRTTVHTDDAVADAAWAGSRTESLRCYLAPHPPGEESGDRTVNLPPDLTDRRPTPEEAAAGRENFAVLQTTVGRFDLLYLTRNGNFRAEWHRDGSDWRGNWVMP